MNLSEYGENEYKVIKINLRKCDDPSAYIEVGLRGVVATEKANTSKNLARESTDAKSQLMVLM